MPEGITYLALVAAIGFVLIAGAKLGAGSPTILGGIFPSQAVRDWPVGVQEPDAPRFAVAHIDALRPGLTPTPESADRTRPPEIVELYERPASLPRTRRTVKGVRVDLTDSLRSLHRCNRKHCPVFYRQPRDMQGLSQAGRAGDSRLNNVWGD